MIITKDDSPLFFYKKGKSCSRYSINQDLYAKTTFDYLSVEGEVMMTL